MEILRDMVQGVEVREAGEAGQGVEVREVGEAIEAVDQSREKDCTIWHKICKISHFIGFLDKESTAVATSPTKAEMIKMMRPDLFEGGYKVNKIHHKV